MCHEALNRPSKGLNMVLNGKFSQPFGVPAVPAQALSGVVYPFVKAKPNYKKQIMTQI